MTEDGRSIFGKIRLYLGCCLSLQTKYINVDIDSLRALSDCNRQKNFSDALQINKYDIFNLPRPDGAADGLRVDAFIAHLPFVDEPRFFRKMKLSLQSIGQLYLAKLYFDAAVTELLAAKYGCREFCSGEPEAIRDKYWLRHYSFFNENRWCYLNTIIFGRHNHSGQFRTNCYTEGRLWAMSIYLGFESFKPACYRWKSDRDVIAKSWRRSFNERMSIIRCGFHRSVY